MGLFGFGKGKSGGLINVIRCDKEDYLIWKWRPEGQEANSTSRENAIRYGSSLRVKDGEVAVFVYKQKDGTGQDFIEGPFDETIKTANFPVLSSIVGLAFGGESPFQAEVYFINLANVIQVKFAIPYFEVFDPRFLDFGVPVAVRGSFTFSINDYREFIKLHRLINFDLSKFESEIKDTIISRTKGVVGNAPSEHQIPVAQIERKTMEIGDLIKQYISGEMQEVFGVKMKTFNLSAIEIDKESEGWEHLRNITAVQQEKTIEKQTDVNLKNLEDTQRINAADMEETLRVRREEMQRAQRLQSEQTYIGAHALDKQAEVLNTAAGSLGQMGSMPMGGGGGATMNPAGMMTGMWMGGAMGSQMANMVNQMGNQMNTQMQNQMNTPPPVPQTVFMVYAGGQQSGPYNINQLAQLVANRQMDNNTLVWKDGMAQWAAAGAVPELAALFAPASGSMPPPPPPVM